MSHNFKMNLELQLKKAINVKSDLYLPIKASSSIRFSWQFQTTPMIHRRDITLWMGLDKTF